MMDSEDGHLFIKNLAHFVRTHEKALANALQLQRQPPRRGQASASGASASPLFPISSSSSTSTAATIAAALSLSSLSLTSARALKPVKLTLTPHHLFYLLSRFEELNVPVGPMNVRLEHLHADTSPAEYVSFLSQAQRMKNKSSDRDSIHSVSSLRSVMSGMSSFWSSFGLQSKSAAKTEKQWLALKEDLRYLYSAFTKIPCLKLSPDHKSRLISGWEEFPFDTAVPLFAFKNLTALEVCDVDFRQFYGWDRVADQLRSLTVKRARLDDPTDLLTNIVLDDMDKRRRKTARAPGSPTTPLTSLSPRPKHVEMARYSPEAESHFPPGDARRLSCDELGKAHSLENGSPARRPSTRNRPRSASPTPPSSSHRGPGHANRRQSMMQMRRSSASSNNSSLLSTLNTPRGSTSNLLLCGTLPTSKWRFLRHLSIADNSLPTLSTFCLAPLANTLQSLDLSSNLFTEIPDALACLTSLRALNLSNCMICSLHSLLRNPLPAVTTLNLRHNRLTSLAGIERILPLERVDFRDNRLPDATEMARLTGLPEIREVFVNRNPFTRMQHNYRITVLNLFRRSPGYTEDIILDASPASYSERKLLVERVPEPIAVPVVKPKARTEGESVARLPTLTPIASAASARSMLEDSALAKMGPPPSSSHHNHYHAHAVASGRKRKATKRRVVELDNSNSSSNTSTSSSSNTNTNFNTNTDSDSNSNSKPTVVDLTSAVQPLSLSLSMSLSGAPPAAGDVFSKRESPASIRLVEPPGQGRPRLLPPITLNSISNSNIISTTTTTTTDTDTDTSEFPLGGGETYKKKIEALRNDLGPAWLSALTDERWDTAPPVAGLANAASMASLAPPSIPVRAHSQGIVTAGRTLG